MNNFDQRISRMDIGRLYFWTATINNWNNLLEEDKLKEIIISSLQYLVKNSKIEVYAFVITRFGSCPHEPQYFLNYFQEPRLKIILPQLDNWYH